MEKKWIIDQKTVRLFLPERLQETRHIIYLNGGHEDAGAIWEEFCLRRNAASGIPLAALAVIDVTGAWNDALTPYPAAKLFRDGEAFSGKADEYLQVLLGDIVPAVETELSGLTGESPLCRSIAGYSLAGLFAVFSFFRTNFFDRCVSVSGSLWYDGFAAWVKKERIMRVPEKVYLSLGEREKNTRNPRMARVETCTAEIAEWFERAGAETLFERNPGGHFDQAVERLVRGLVWISESSKQTGETKERKTEIDATQTD